MFDRRTEMYCILCEGLEPTTYRSTKYDGYTRYLRSCDNGHKFETLEIPIDRDMNRENLKVLVKVVEGFMKIVKDWR